MNTVLKSDFIMWTFTKIAKDQMLSFLGATPELQEKMTPDEQRGVSELIKLIFPVSQRQAGIVNDEINSKNFQRYAVENIRAPIQIEMRKSAENYDKHRFEVYRNNLLGLDEMRHSA